MESLCVVLAPSVTMAVGSLTALGARVPPKVQACTQNFSAGLLLSAVAGELYPLMDRDLGTGTSVVAITIGFALGLAFMFGLEAVTEGGEEDEDGETEGTDTPKRNASSGSSMTCGLLEGEAGKRAMQVFSKEIVPLLEEDMRQLDQAVAAKSRDDIDSALHSSMFHVDKGMRSLQCKSPLDEFNLTRMRFHLDELKGNTGEARAAAGVKAAKQALKDFQGTLEHIHGHAERQAFCRWKVQAIPPTGVELSEKIPWAVVAAVTADGGVDGLLIGLAFAANPTAGWAMSIATCIEMGFLGLSFCATLTNATRNKAKVVMIAAMPPLALVCAGLTGTVVGGLLQEIPAVFVSFIAFSIVALLFLVTQELLTEAREVAEDNAFINSMIFVGLLGGILLSKLLG